jgi:hypothetical protein
VKNKKANLRKKKKQKVDLEKELKKIVDDQIRQKSLEKIKRRNW